MKGGGQRALTSRAPGIFRSVRSARIAGFARPFGRGGAAALWTSSDSARACAHEALLARLLLGLCGAIPAGAAGKFEDGVMSLSVGSSSSALSYIQSLLQSGSSSAASTSSDPLASLEQMLSSLGGTGTSSDTKAASSGGSPPPFQSNTFSALLSLQGGDGGASGMSSLFSQLDSDGDGTVSKTDFDKALGATGVNASSADNIFAEIDKDGDGIVSQDELAATAGRAHRHGGGGGAHAAHGAGGASGASGSDDSSASDDGSTTETTVAADGTITTTVTYADGSTSTTVTPPQQTGSSNTGDDDSSKKDKSQVQGGFANLLDQLKRMQAQMLGQASSLISTVV
jgi:hypothetical protein